MPRCYEPAVRVPSTDAVQLELHDLGGRGPVLLIAHATGFCAGAYRPLATALNQSFHVWALDFRGHGDSTGPAGGDFDWAGMGEDVLAAADALAEERHGGPVFAFGHSMGGAGLMLAELARPGLLRAAYLYEPIILPPGSGPNDPGGPGNEPPASGHGPNFMAESARRRRRSFGSKAEALYRYASRPPLDGLRADALAAYVDAGFTSQEDSTVTLKCTPEREAATFESTGKPSADQLSSITAPVTFARGLRDAEGGVATYAEVAADRLPGSRLRAYDHLGHFGPFQDPETLAADIVADLLRARRRPPGHEPVGGGDGRSGSAEWSSDG